MRILVITGSRADYGLLEWPIKTLMADPFFDVTVLRIWGMPSPEAFSATRTLLEQTWMDMILVLGDRYEILAAVTAAHLARVPVAHIAGGDVTEGSYDDAMRDCISRMASVHFVTSSSAMARLTGMGFHNVHLVGSPGIDYIRRADWKKERPIAEPYVVVSYQAETIDGTNEIDQVLASLPPDKHAMIMRPNPDADSKDINSVIDWYSRERQDALVYDFLPHADFLNLLAHCDEFIGNSSAMLYEAPELGVKTRMIGKRQRGRTIPMGDGFASERIAKVLRYVAH